MSDKKETYVEKFRRWTNFETVEKLDQLNYNPETEMAFAFDISCNSGAKNYFKLPKSLPEHIAKIDELLRNHDYHLYEIIDGNIPIKQYFDLELGKDRYKNNPEIKTSDDKDRMDKSLFIYVSGVIIRCYKTMYGVTVRNGDMCVLNSCCDDKLSYHIIIYKAVYANNVTEAGVFARYVSSEIQKNSYYEEAGHRYSLMNGETITIVDILVYRPHQLMRLAGQSKFKYANAGIKLKIVNNYKYQITDTFVSHKIRDEKDTLRLDITIRSKIGNVIPVEISKKTKPTKTLAIKNEPANLEQKPVENKNPQPVGDNVLTPEEQQILDEAVAGALRLYAEHIEKTGKYLKAEKNIGDEEFLLYPQWKRSLYLITSQSCYRTWVIIGLAVLRVGGEEAIADFVEFCKLNKKYKVNEERKILNIKKRDTGFDIGSLNFLAIQTNPTFFATNPRDKYIDKHCYALDSYFLVDTKNINVIIEKTRYLATNDDGTPNKNGETDDKFVIFNAMCGSGKTKLIQKTIKKFKRVIFITSRQSLAKSIKNDFGMNLYLDPKVDINNCDELILQLESVIKLLERVVFDCVVFDEIESILKQFISITMYGKSRKIFFILMRLINSAQKVIFADGFIKQRTIDFCMMFIDLEKQHMPEHRVTMIHNIHELAIKRRAMQLEDCEIVGHMKQSLQSGKNIFVCLGSRDRGDDIHMEMTQELVELLPFIIYYHRDNPTEIKNTLSNINVSWKTKRAVLTTPTITCGLSYDIDLHFDVIYVITAPNSCVVSDVMQQMFRVRNTKENVVYFSLKRNSGYGRRGKNTDIPYDENSGKILTKECKAVMNECIALLGDNVEKQKILQEGMESIREHENFDKLIEFNTMESNLSRQHYNEMFMSYLKLAGFEVTALETMKADARKKRIPKGDKQPDEVVQAENLEKFRGIKTITDLEFDDNKRSFENKEGDMPTMLLQNSKYIFLKHINETLSEMVKANIFYDYWRNEHKAVIIRNVFYEKNKNVNKRIYNEYVKKEGIYQFFSKEPQQHKYILVMNKLLRLNSSYDTTTIITKETIMSAKPYFLANWEQMRITFNSNLRFPANQDDETAYKSFAYNAIRTMYDTFCEHVPEVYNEGGYNNDNLHLLAYKMVGENWDVIVKKHIPAPKKEKIPKVNYDNVLNEPEFEQ